MADEVTPYFELKCVDSEGTRLSFKFGDGVTFTTTIKRFVRAKIEVGTTAELPSLGDVREASVSVLGWCCVVNRDDTNFITISRSSDFISMMKVPPLSGVLFHFGSDMGSSPTSLRFQADTAACQVDYLIIATEP